MADTYTSWDDLPGGPGETGWDDVPGGPLVTRWDVISDTLSRTVRVVWESVAHRVKWGSVGHRVKW